jgi:hypothetical protein
MLELYTLTILANQNSKKNCYDLTQEEKKNVNIAITVIVIIELILWIWAITRALKCSTSNPDSRVVHLMFATFSPLLYLLFSFSVDGMCQK